MKGKSASFVKHLVLDVAGTPLAGNFHAGQSFGVITPGVDDAGKRHKVRLYSIASPTWGEDGEAQVLSTTPKRVIDESYLPRPRDDPSDHRLFLGVCSNYLCAIQAGDQVCITGPNGHRFLLPLDHDAHDYLFLATGTGIAPFRGMLMELLRNPAGACRSRIDLVMGTPYTTDLLYDELFRQLATEHDNFNYHTAISREAQIPDGSGLYVHDLIEQQFEHFAPLLASERTLLYVCGLEGMRYGLIRTLARHRLGAGYFHVGDALRDREPANWSDVEIRRCMKPAARSFLEVY